MFDDSGFGCLGAEESAKDKTLNVIKKVGPGLISAVSEELDKKDDKKPDKDTGPIKHVKEEPSWFVRPVAGPIPGWGVLVGGVGILGTIGLILKKILAR